MKHYPHDKGMDQGAQTVYPRIPKVKTVKRIEKPIAIVKLSST